MNGRQIHSQCRLTEGEQMGQECTEVCPEEPGSCVEIPVKQKDVVVFQQNGSVSQAGLSSVPSHRTELNCGYK